MVAFSYLLEFFYLFNIFSFFTTHTGVTKIEVLQLLGKAPAGTKTPWGATLDKYPFTYFLTYDSTKVFFSFFLLYDKNTH
jgi:hypothetical protein